LNDPEFMLAFQFPAALWQGIGFLLLVVITVVALVTVVFQFPDAGHTCPGVLCRDFDSYSLASRRLLLHPQRFQFPDAGHTVPAPFAGVLILTLGMEQSMLGNSGEV